MLHVISFTLCLHDTSYCCHSTADLCICISTGEKPVNFIFCNDLCAWFMSYSNNFCIFWASFVCMSCYMVTIFSAFCHYGDTCRFLFLPLCFFFLLQVDVAWEPEGGPWLHPVAFEQWRCIRHKGAAAPWTSSPQPLRYGQPGRKKTQMASNWNHGTTLIVMALIAHEVRKNYR